MYFLLFLQINTKYISRQKLYFNC